MRVGERSVTHHSSAEKEEVGYGFA